MNKFLPIAFVAVLLSAMTAQGQQIQVDKVDVKGISAETQPTPEFRAGNVKDKSNPSPRDWLEVEVEFEASANERGAAIPELLFRYYVAIQGKDGQTQVLTGDVTHVNVVSGEKYYSAIYVSPMSLGTITGNYRKFQTSAIQAVAVEVFFNGVSKGGESQGGPGGRWWESMATKPGVLSREKTPFGLLWIDRYADVKPTE